jgi:hypothetical protein
MNEGEGSLTRDSSDVEFSAWLDFSPEILEREFVSRLQPSSGEFQCFLPLEPLKYDVHFQETGAFPSCAFQSAMACGYTKPSITEWPLSISEDFVRVEFRLHFPKLLASY